MNVEIFIISGDVLFVSFRSKDMLLSAGRAVTIRVVAMLLSLVTENT